MNVIASTCTYLKENKKVYRSRAFRVKTQETEKTYGSPDTQQNEHHRNEGQLAFCFFLITSRAFGVRKSSPGLNPNVI